MDDLVDKPNQTEPWNGVRNYQARNMMRDDMKVGDRGFFYHSSCAVPGITGIIEVVRQGYPDHTAWDSHSPYFDADSTPDNPRWYMVDVKLIKRFNQPITLKQLKANQQLASMLILRKGNRLSITPVTTSEWGEIVAMEVVD